MSNKITNLKSRNWSIIRVFCSNWINTLLMLCNSLILKWWTSW